MLTASELIATEAELLRSVLGSASAQMLNAIWCFCLKITLFAKYYLVNNVNLPLCTDPGPAEHAVLNDDYEEAGLEVLPLERH